MSFRGRRLGKYRVGRRIGVGGMAEVYQAELRGPAGFSRTVALKLLLSERHRDPQSVDMFIDEATIAARFDHPNIVRVYDFGEESGLYFLAMELIDGWTVRQLLDRYRATRQPFPLPGAAYIARQVCRGLHHIHSDGRGIVHRDITPNNIFVTAAGEVKVGDFGIAKAVRRRTQTVDGQIKGNLGYLAPEQASGDPVTARTDIYATGLVLFEMLTDRRLLDASEPLALLKQAVDPEQIAVSRLRPDAAPLDPIVARALQQQPTLRYPTAALFGTELQRYLDRCGMSGTEHFLGALAKQHQLEQELALARTVGAEAPDQPASVPMSDAVTDPLGRRPTYAAHSEAALRAELPPTDATTAVLLRRPDQQESAPSTGAPTRPQRRPPRRNATSVPARDKERATRIRLVTPTDGDATPASRRKAIRPLVFAAAGVTAIGLAWTVGSLTRPSSVPPVTQQKIGPVSPSALAQGPRPTGASAASATSDIQDGVPAQVAGAGGATTADATAAGGAAADAGPVAVSRDDLSVAVARDDLSVAPPRATTAPARRVTVKSRRRRRSRGRRVRRADGSARSKRLVGAPRRTVSPEKAATGVLTVAVLDGHGKPLAATVKIDGRPAGQAPLVRRLAAGSHRLAVRMAGYRSADRGVDLAAGARQRVVFRLEAGE